VENHSSLVKKSFSIFPMVIVCPPPAFTSSSYVEKIKQKQKIKKLVELHNLFSHIHMNINITKIHILILVPSLQLPHHFERGEQ